MPIASRLVDTDHIIDGAVTAEKIAALAIIAEKIAAGAIIAEKIGAGEITAEKIAALAITAEKIAADAIIASKIAAGAIIAEKIGAGEVTALKINVDTLSAINVNLGEIIAGLLTSVIIQTKSIPPRVRLDENGFYYQVTTATGKYGTFKYGDGTKYGAGVLAFLCNPSFPILSVMAEQSIADVRLYNRGSNPSGAAVIGDLAVVNGKLVICTTAGTPGTWTVVGSQS